MVARNFSSAAVAATLTAPLAATDTVAYVSDVTGWPAVPFTLIIDKDRAAEEVITVTSLTGLSVVIERGVDGTPALEHPVGAPVVHGASARDFREPAVHVGATSNVHGVVGNLVGDTDTRAALPDNPMSADRVRWEHIQRIYELCGRNVSETARRLNMHRRTLQRILAKRAPR